MAWQATSWAKRVKTGAPAKKAVLMVIAERADQWGYSWAGQILIAEEAEVSERSVRRHVTDLARDGILKVYQAREKDGSKRNLYQLSFEPTELDKMPDDHPSKSGRYKLLDYADDDVCEDVGDGPECGGSEPDPPDNLTGGPPDNLTGGATGHHGSTHRTPRVNPPDRTVSGEPYRTTKEPSAPAREAPPAERGGGASPATGEAERAKWAAAIDQLKAELGDGVFSRWVKPLELAGVTEAGAVVQAPTPFMRDWVTSNYGDRLRELWGGPIRFVFGGQA